MHAEKNDRSAVIAGAVAGVFIGVIVTFVIGVIVFVVIRKRSRNKKGKIISCSNFKSVHACVFMSIGYETLSSSNNATDGNSSSSEQSALKEAALNVTPGGIHLEHDQTETLTAEQ